MTLNHDATHNLEANNTTTTNNLPEAWLNSKTRYNFMRPSKKKLDVAFNFKEQQHITWHDLKSRKQPSGIMEMNM